MCLGSASGSGSGVRSRGSEVRGTCRPLRVHSGTHPEGGRGVVESPHVGVVVSVEEHEGECVTACINYQHLYGFITGHMTPSAYVHEVSLP